VPVKETLIVKLKLKMSIVPTAEDTALSAELSNTNLCMLDECVWVEQATRLAQTCGNGTFRGRTSGRLATCNTQVALSTTSDLQVKEL
jgi:hypothetical protein